MAQGMTREMQEAQRQMKRDFDQLKAAHGRLKKTVAEDERIIADLRLKLEQALTSAGIRNLVQGYRDACNDMRKERDDRQTALQRVYELAKGEPPAKAVLNIAEVVEHAGVLPSDLLVPLQG